MNSVATTILLVDEHLLFRKGLKKLLHEEPDFSVVGDVADLDDAVRAAKQFAPDVILVGLSGRPLIRVMWTLQQLSALGTQARTIVLMTTVEKSHMIRALQLGACGIVSKSSSPELLFDSVRCVKAGQYWVESEQRADLERALELLQTPANGSRTAKFGLTPREQEILSAVARGESNKAMAARFSISEDTVKHHLTHVFDKTGVLTRLELAVFAMNHDLISKRASQ